jgi:hypothetical protein
MQPMQRKRLASILLVGIAWALMGDYCDPYDILIGIIGNYYVVEYVGWGGFGGDPPAASNSTAHASAVPSAKQARASTRQILQQTPSAYSLASGTFSLPFLGNTLLLGLNQNGVTASGDVLLRQSNCSLTEIVAGGTGVTSLNVAASLPGAQDYLHQLAGLTTTADLFTNGCKDTVLGVPAKFTEYVGQTKSGNYLVADAGSSTSNLIIFQFSASGTYVSQTTLASNVFGLVAVADLNNDGYNDIIANGVTDPTTSTTGLGVFLSNGDGTFQAPVVYPYPTSNQFTVDDVNGDGKPDILLLTPGLNGAATVVTTLLGKGDGTFTVGPSVTTVQPAVGNSYAPLITGDFTGDGKKDIITGNDYLHGAGDGSFTVASSTLPFINYYSVVVGDFNGDGKLDVAGLLLNSGNFGAVTVYLGNGNGTFTQGATYSAVVGGSDLLVTDIDGDGNQDLVVGLGGNGAYSSDELTSGLFQVLMGRGDGTFVAAPITPSVVEPQGTVGVAPAVADFTGDGKLDLLTPAALNAQSSYPAAISVLPGNNSGVFGTAITTTINFVPNVVAAAKLSAHGNLDALAASGNNVAVLFGNGDGTFSHEQDYTLPSGAAATMLATGDFNGDGIIDIAVAAGGGASPSGVFILLGNAGGTFAAPVQVDASLNPSIAVADLNGDGRADLVVADRGNQPNRVAGTIHVYLGNANGSFASQPPAALSAPGAPTLFYQAVAIADMNNDGKLDIVAGGFDSSLNGQLMILIGKGDGTFTQGGSGEIPGADEDPVSSIAIADFNKVGNLDVAFALSDHSGIAFGGGDGTLIQATWFGVAGNPSSLTATDLNGDGYTDLLVGSGAGAVALLNQYGQQPPAFTVTQSPSTGTVTAGQSASTTLTLTPSNGFTGAVSLTCSGLPTGAACGFSPASVTVNGAAATSTLTITTTARTAMNSSSSPFNPLLPGGLLLAGFGLPIAWRRRREIARMSYHSLPALLLISAVALPGCGGGSSSSSGTSTGSGSSTSSSSGSSSSSSSSSGGTSSSSSSSGGSSGGGSMGTPAGSYTVTITATAGSTTQTTTYTLTVN